jgi:hypothetical protein
MDGSSERQSPKTRRRTNAACVAAVVVCATGCARTTLVPEGAPIRIGPNASARVYTISPPGDDGRREWVLSPNVVALPEGWYLLPPSFVPDETQ